MKYGGHFDAETKQNKLTQLDKEMKKPNFWDDRVSAEKIIEEYNSIKQTLDKTKKVKEEIEFISENIKETDEVTELAEEEIKTIEKALNDLEINILLNDKYDTNDAILEIHSGAGGTEACDWASMLYRMYSKWINKKGYKEEITDKQLGLET